MALAVSLVALAAWLLWDWVQHRLRARERELANSLTQDLDVDSIKRLVGEVYCLQLRGSCGLHLLDRRLQQCDIHGIALMGIKSECTALLHCCCPVEPGKCC